MGIIDSSVISIIAAFATYRTARMISTERGPFDIFTYIQNWVYDRWDENSWQYDGITCPLCVGLWIALVAAILFFGWDFWIWWLPISGLQAWLQKQER